MPDTSLKISMNEYMRLVAKDAARAESSPLYKKLLDDLSQFSAMMMEYFEVNEEGKAKTLTPDDYNKLIKGYTTLAEDCTKFLSADHEKNRLESKRINIITKLSSCVGKDLRGLLEADRSKPLTLSDVVKDARTRIVDLTGKDLGRMGGALSSRIPLKSTSGAEGFFTKKSINTNKDDLQAVMDRIPEILPPAYREIYNKGGEEVQEFLEALRKNNIQDIYSNNRYDRYQSQEAYYDIMRTLNRHASEGELDRLIMQNDGFIENLQQIQKDYRHLNNQRNIFTVAGLQDKTRIDQRNSAMTDVAAMLGMSGIIAKATPMKIIIDGEVTEGTFMEKAEGEDLTRLTTSSKALKTDKNSFNHPEGLKALADLQILDYICGNIDRHQGNLLYQFGEDHEGKTVLTGVCGIDNDTSFGTRTFSDNSFGKDITSLPNIKNITKSCYETLLNFPVDALKVVLADKLTKEELDAVCERAGALKKRVEAIAKGKEKKLKVVDDHEWGKGNYTYDKLTANGKGIAGTIVTAISSIEKRQKWNELGRIPNKVSEIVYTDGDDASERIEVKFEEIYGKLEKFVTRAGEIRKFMHVNSSEYNEMLRSLKTALDSGKTIKEGLNENPNIDPEAFNAFAQTVENLGVASQKYINAKNISQYTDFGKDRIALANDMRDLAPEYFTVKEMPVNENAAAKQQEEVKGPEMMA